MKKISTILICIFLTISSNSFAEWTQLNKDMKGNTFYIDYDRIRKIDGYIYYWILTDYFKNQNGKLSFKVYKQGDCKLFRFKFLTFSFHQEAMGRGNGNTEKPIKKLQGWHYPTPNSNNEIILRKVCN